jgi:cytochrome c oxidase assembly protein subunit 11
MPGLPWEISPQIARLDVHPGELHQVMYRVRNISNEPIVAQAVPSVSPGVAATSFSKLDCFCFTQQALAPGETKELPLLFTVKPDIDKGVHTITLAYAFFNTDTAKPASKQE